MEKSLDRATLSLDRSESQAKRLSQQIRELRETVNALQDAEQFEDPELAISVVSRTFTCVSDHHRVSDSNLASRNVVSPFSRDTVVSPFLNNTPVHVEKATPVSGVSASSFSKAPLVSPTAESQAAAFQAAAYLPTLAKTS